MLCGSALALGPWLAGAAEPSPDPATAKPAWVNEMSLSVKESYDDNVYLSGVDQSFMSSGYSTLKGISSWVTTVSPKLDLNLTPLWGDQEILKALSLSYAPDFVVYHDAGSEDYQAHRFGTSLRLKSDAFSVSIDNGLSYIHGNHLGPSYPNCLLSAYATVTARERREQIQDRAKIALQYDAEKWLLRPNATLLYYDLMTLQKATTTAEGYQNYPDRHDVNGGFDAGYKITPDLTAVLGYRHGHQSQEQFAWELWSTPSDYDRVLLGMEGKLLPWLKFEGLFGPDFRSYPEDSATHITPVNDYHPVKFYGEAMVAAEISKDDLLTFKFRQFQWVSSTGRNPALDSLYDLGYRRRFTEKLTFDLGGRFISSDYNSSTLPTGTRNDGMIALTTGWRYALTSHLSADLGYSLDLGLNLQKGLTHPENREFARHIFGAGLQAKL